MFGVHIAVHVILIVSLAIVLLFNYLIMKYDLFKLEDWEDLLNSREFHVFLSLLIFLFLPILDLLVLFKRIFKRNNGE